MRLISGVKMQRAVKKTLSSRNFAFEYEQIIPYLHSAEAAKHPLTVEISDEVDKSLPEALVVFTSDRGLCGGYNSQLFRSARDYVIQAARPIQLFAIGSYAAKLAKQPGVELVAAYPSDLGAKDFDNIASIANELIRLFLAKKIGHATLLFSDYVNSFQNKVTHQTLLPIEVDLTVPEAANPPLIEPGEVELLDFGLRKLIQVRIYNALLNAQSSEHSARMLAMQNATDAAMDVAESLNLQFNKLRQAAITQEVAEILNGSLNN